MVIIMILERLYNKARRCIFDAIESMPSLIAKPLSLVVVYMQNANNINEIKKITREKQCSPYTIKNMMVNNILIIRLDSIGDMMWTTPFIRELRRNFPDANIDMIVRPVASTVLKNCPYIDNIYEYDCPVGDNDKQEKNEVKKARAEDFMQSLLKKKNAQYDYVFLPREIFMGDMLDNIYLAQYSRGKYLFGRSYGTNQIELARSHYAKKIFSAFSLMIKPEHEVLQILDELSLVGKSYKSTAMEVWLSQEEADFASDWCAVNNLKNNDIVIGVGLKGSAASRSWKIENYKAVFSSVKAYRGRKVWFVLLGDRALSQADVAGLGSFGNVIDMAGKTSLRQVVALLSRITVYLGADTGIMHVATAFKKPVVEISGHFQNGRIMDSGSAVLVGPWNVEKIVLEPPGGLDGCVGWCTASYSHCINQVRPEQVAEALRIMFDKLHFEK